MKTLTERPELSNRDHVFAKWLREHDAINNWVKESDSINVWFRDGPRIDENIVAKAYYDNQGLTYRVFTI